MKETWPNSKFTAEQAQAIRLDTRPARQLAKEYGVSPSTITRLKRGQTWRIAGSYCPCCNRPYQRES